MSISNPSGEYSTRTIRIPVEWDVELNKIAVEKSVSVNNILNQLLKDYLYNVRYLEAHPHINVSLQSFRDIMEEVSEDKAYEIGKSLGRTEPRSSLLLRGMEVSFENIEWLLENVYSGSEYMNLFLHEFQDEYMIYITHSCGLSWSMYLKGYFDEFFKTLFDTDVETHETVSSLEVRINKKTVSKV
jgi:hypothetical protein